MVISLRHCCFALVCSAFGAAADAQSLTGVPIACKGERVTRIDIDARPPFQVTGNNFWQRFGRFTRKAHATTKDPVIRRFMALEIGDPCTELRRSESERILRAQPFLADANIIAVSDGAGGVVLNVVTVDEVSLILGGALSSQNPNIRAMRLGQANLMGEGMYVAGQWKSSRFFRDVVSGKFVDYQFLGRPYQLSVEGGRREIGSDWATELSHPFLTDLQRLSWRTTAGSSEGYFHFRRPEARPAALYFARTYGDIGGVVRLGPPLGKIALVGGSVSYEDEDPERRPVVIIDSLILPDSSTALIDRYSANRTTRLNGLWGVRNIDFIRATGFDALEGAQDLRTGVQVATLIGKGVKFLGGREDDWFGSTELYGGFGSPRSFAALDITGEGRRDQDGKWDGMLAHGRGAIYLKPFERHKHTVITDLAWSGGWKQRVPFQLTFADRDGGVRGFRKADVGGGRRLVGRFEDRYVIGKFRKLASIGVAGFGEAGKIWAGDSPFGVDTKVHSSIGVSFLAATPPQSRRLWRVDFAYPVSGDRSGWEVRVTSKDLTRVFRPEPRDIFSSRERSVPSSVFNWP